MNNINEENEDLTDYVDSLGEFGAFISTKDRVMYLTQPYQNLIQMLIKIRGTDKSAYTICICQDQLWLIKLGVGFHSEDGQTSELMCGGIVVKPVKNAVNCKGIH